MTLVAPMELQSVPSACTVDSLEEGNFSQAPEGDQRQCGAVTQLVVTSKKQGKKLGRNGGGEVTLHFIDKGTRKMRPLFVFCVDKKFFLSSRKSPEKESQKNAAPMRSAKRSHYKKRYENSDFFSVCF